MSGSIFEVKAKLGPGIGHQNPNSAVALALPVTQSLNSVDSCSRLQVKGRTCLQSTSRPLICIYNSSEKRSRGMDAV